LVRTLQAAGHSHRRTAFKEFAKVRSGLDLDLLQVPAGEGPEGTKEGPS
jgi:hypothetical protein